MSYGYDDSNDNFRFKRSSHDVPKKPFSIKNSLIKVSGALVLAFALGFGMTYLAYGLGTGIWSPSGQYEYATRKSEERRLDFEARDSLINRLFGVGGLADTNHDGKISALERVQAYERMGEEVSERIRVTSPAEHNLSAEELMRAVDSYENR